MVVLSLKKYNTPHTSQKEKWMVPDMHGLLGLNKSYSKDNFLVPHTDLLVDTAIVHEALAFMIRYLGYKQINIHPKDDK